jgi:hypothetical protein
MTKNFKRLVEHIQKTASPPPAPPAGYVPGKPAPKPANSGVVTPTTHSAPVSSGNTGIMAMQHALQDLAHDVSSQINLQDAFSGDPTKEQEAKERDAFGVFLTKNYMRNTNVSGVEFDPNPKITDVSQKRPDDPTRMSVVMDTMNRIGTPKRGEQFVDGDWGARTNAALRDAYAFASGLFSFVNDINRFAQKKMVIKSYTPDRLQSLEQVATEDNSLTPQQKSEFAPAIANEIKDIKKMYDEVKNQVLQHPAYQQFIEGSVPFKSFQPSVTQEQLDLLNKQFPQGFTINVGQTPTKIPVESLRSLDSLKKLVPNANAQDIVSQIWKQQEKLLGPDPGF